MLRIAICEDNPADAQEHRGLVLDYRSANLHLNIDITLFHSAGELLEAVNVGGSFHLYLLDIIMPEINGMELAKALRTRQRGGVIIFLTSAPEYSLEAFSVRAFDFLVKPIARDTLFRALDDAVAVLGREVETYITIDTAAGQRNVRQSDILYVETKGHVLNYHLAGGEVLAGKVLRVPFEEAAVELIADWRFVRPHRSFLVNATHVELFSKSRLVMDSGAVIPVSRLRANSVEAEYMRFLARMGGSRV